MCKDIVCSNGMINHWVCANTDGLIVWIPNTDEAFDQMDDICYEWEQRCSTELCEIGLALDCIREIHQKDVNNYLWIDIDGDVEKKGAYLKDLSPTDYDLPVINKAMTEYFVHGVPVEDYINDCDDLIEFQKIVKLSGKYDRVGWEYGKSWRKRSKNGGKAAYEFSHMDVYDNKCYRVFASKNPEHGRLLKLRLDPDTKSLEVVSSYDKEDKFGSTPEHCFIDNTSMKDRKVPDNLDKQWYINLAKKRLKQYGVDR